ncbi:hypothetical protein IXO151_20590 [Xanthomonas oryzae pv. oryzae]|nr:hypothetical protein IXO151_20590 [Xanthomonas oryzae pv. oryzae]
MAAWHWPGLAISAEVLQLKVRANQERIYLIASINFRYILADNTSFSFVMLYVGLLDTPSFAICHIFFYWPNFGFFVIQ